MHNKIEELLAAHKRHLDAESEGTDAEYERTGVELEEAKNRLLRAAPSASLPLTEDQIQRIYDRYGGDMFNCTRAIERHCQQAEPSASQWQPIETAPKEGACLLAIATDGEVAFAVLERDKDGNWIHEGEPTFCHSYYFEPTHWMPLPAAPIKGCA